MKYDIIFAPEAVNDHKNLTARDRSIVLNKIEEHLRNEPKKISRSRIKRLKGIIRPQYRLRIDDIRVFYDVTDTEVHILAIVDKPKASEWLEQMGEKK